MAFPDFDYKLLKALDAVVSEQSFERAAKRLHLTQSAVSQRIKLLESQLGQPLLIRGQPLHPSPLGQQLLGHYQRVIQLETELSNQLNVDEQQAQSLPLAVNADSLASWLIPALSPLLQQQRVEMNLYVEDESRTWQRMRSGEALACVTSKATPIAGSDSHFLGYMEYLCVATPAFIERFFANGVDRQSLSRAPGMSFDQHDDMHIQFLLEHFSLRPGQYPCHTVRSSEAFMELALASGAYSLNPRLHVAKHLADGSLVNLVPEHQVRVPLYWHHWQLAGKLMRQLSEQIRTYTQTCLPQL
ncbi:LysR family transcriptional regulator ArgP [Agarivorans sp. TSD2052]|uniref:LysR family transcriptional regulator ArgP n=1 Tax=Agarivorans sp. TSD2052 TaxID=2937286 RepID=UPI00200FB3B0|nr:LysR family transcriptional regulator ArgP [Agarivorans sp. TSD2052]UPW19000.1 LysR family transcriptional regulator ArgP [Agarivorans sp. TSD2052]